MAGDDRYQDKPDKGFTRHVCEAQHYGLLGAGEGPLTEMRSRRRAEMKIDSEKRCRERERNGWYKKYE